MQAAPATPNPHGLEPKQEQKFLKFKQKLTDKKILPNPIFDDWYILRFFRAKNCNITLSVSLLAKWVKKREEHDIANVFSKNTQQFEAALSQFLSMGFTGWDKFCNPVFYVDLKNVTDASTVPNFPDEEIWNWALRTGEIDTHVINPVMLKLTGRVPSKEIMLINLNNMDMKAGVKLCKHELVKKTMKLFGKMATDYYPGIVSNTYIMNAPDKFLDTWNIVKVFLPESLRETIVI